MSILTRLGRGALPAAVVLSFAACDGSPTEELDPPTITLTVPTRVITAGNTLQASARVTEADGSASNRAIQWRSTDLTVATVNGSGLVTGVGPGITTISASVGGTTQSVQVEVLRAPAAGAPQSTFLAFTSTPGDWIGQGQTAQYSLGSGTWTITLSANRNELHVGYTANGGTTYWNAFFAAPAGQTLNVGTYQNATRWPFQSAASPGLAFTGSNRGCNTISGRFTIHDLTLDSEGNLHRFHATFRQHCEGGASYLDGEVAVLRFPLR